MTVPTQTNKAIFTANGVTTEFPFTFGTLPTADLVVTLIDGDEETVVNPSDYTVRGAGRDDGGSVVFNDPPASGLTVLIQRLVPYTQPTDYKNQGSFYPRTHERSFDRATMQIQQLGEELGRSFRLPAHVIGVTPELPAPQALASLVWSADGTRLENGSPDGTGDMLLRPDLGQAAPGKGASLVAFLQDGAGAVARTIQDKLRERGSFEDFGAVGDGLANDTAAVTSALARGGSLALKPGAVYRVDPGTEIPSGVQMETNGARFVAASSSGSLPVFYLSSGVVVDHLHVEIPEGVTARGVYILDQADVEIGTLRVEASTQQEGPSTLQALTVARCQNLRVGQVTATNYDRPIRLQDSSGVHIGGVTLTSYVRGLYVESCTGVYVGKSRITGAAPGATVSAGHNALLIQSENSDCTDLVFEDLYVANSGEHGIRIGGGSFQTRNVRFVRPVLTNTGASGIKIQAVADGASEFLHTENVKIIEPICEDIGPADMSGITNGFDNYNAIIAKYVRGLTITSPIIRNRNRTYAAKGGIYLSAVSKWEINGGLITDTKFDGIKIDLNSTGNVDVNDGHVVGTTCSFNGQHGININYPAWTIRRVFFSDVVLCFNGGWGVSMSGGGAINLMHIRGVVESNTAGGVSSASSGVLVHMAGQFNDANVRNGSTWQDRAGGHFKVKKEAGWTNF